MLRRLTRRRAAGTAVAGALAVAGVGLVALAPAAHAGTVNATVRCTPPIVAPMEGPQDITVELTPATVASGGLVHAAVTLGPSPATSPIALSDIPMTPSITLAMHGAATGQVTVTGPTTLIDVPAGQPITAPPYAGDFTVPPGVTGGIDFTIVSMNTQTDLSSMGLGIQNTPCSLTAGGDVTVASVTVEGSTGENPTLNVGAPAAHTGTDIALTGANFAAGATASLTLCQTDGTGCVASAFTAKTIAIDASGKLTGTATLAKSGIPDGDYLVQVTDGAKAATAPLHVSTFVPVGDPVLTLDRGSGAVGTVVNVSGSNLPPNSTIRLNGVNAQGGTESGSKNYVTNGDGVLAPSPYTIQTAGTTGVRVRLLDVAGSPQYVLPFTISADLRQTPTVTLAAGPLTMTQAGDAINFGSATLNGTAQTLTANLNQVTVTDSRGGNLGWSLTGTMTDLVAANGTDKIPAGNIAWTPSCAAAPGSLSSVTNGTPGPLGTSAATLCAQAPDPAAATGGEFTADAGLTLTTPAFAAAGTYTGTLTLSLI
ncbi:WxL domain-containing protein [Yinghuangia sp. ASG 101]|uniref:WxL domain-containing protein n=1 Tax=Yinghuangia sp. ASG 101 TaxID=2896848 RepID=UPI001E42B191|nr:WxL domain-containing protein [Yinghuangia sp. ASG 101]UGQ14066.1 WxL domain-containing protein [Yinghuangia sp. ASG 101]